MKEMYLLQDTPFINCQVQQYKVLPTPTSFCHVMLKYRVHFIFYKTYLSKFSTTSLYIKLQGMYNQYPFMAGLGLCMWCSCLLTQ